MEHRYKFLFAICFIILLFAGIVSARSVELPTAEELEQQKKEQGHILNLIIIFLITSLICVIIIFSILYKSKVSYSKLIYEGFGGFFISLLNIILSSIIFAGLYVFFLQGVEELMKGFFLEIFPIISLALLNLLLLTGLYLTFYFHKKSQKLIWKYATTFNLIFIICLDIYLYSISCKGFEGCGGLFL